MITPFVATGPAAGATALLTMSGSTEGALPECRAGTANHIAGGEASAKKLTIGYLLCNEEDRHHPLSSRRLGHIGPDWSTSADGVSLPRSAAERQLPTRGAPPRTPAADPRPAAEQNSADAGGSRGNEHGAGHGSSGGGRDVREPRSSPRPPPRHSQPAGHGERAARLFIPPLRMAPPDRQGGGTASTEGRFEWSPVGAAPMGGFGDGRQEWPTPAHWAGPLVNRNDRPAPLPPAHPPNPSTGGTWNGLREVSTQHPSQMDQPPPVQETSPSRPERTTDNGQQGSAVSAPLSEASDVAGHRQRRLQTLWRPVPAAETDPPSSGCARVAGPDLPRQRPYVPVDGRVARVAFWQRSVGGVVGGTGLPYPPRRALHSPVRRLESVFHGGLPPLRPPTSTSLSMAKLQRSPPAAPLTRPFDRVDAGAAPADGAKKGGLTVAPDQGSLGQPRHPAGDNKERVPDRERGNPSPQVQPVDVTNGVSSNPVKVEAPPGAVDVIYPTDKPELDPESAAPHACDECSERFPHRSQLQSHVRNVHERAGRPFECEHCGSRFRQRAHKQKHVAAVHLKEKPYTCKICWHCFGRRSDLNKHDRLVHKRERPYGCDFPGCHARFGQKGDSKKHMATHERSEARRRAAAAAVVATAAAVAKDAATSTGVASVDDPPGRGRHGDWHSPQERPGAVRDGGRRQTEREWEVEDGDDVDCADKVDNLTRLDDDGDNVEKEANDDGDDEGSEGLAHGMYHV